jgi:dolichyl-phosphate-mannose--protein O-mannosyl transferase
MEYIRNKVSKALAKFNNFRYKSDVLVVVCLLFVSAIVRIPFIEYPPMTVGDEAIFEYYTVSTFMGVPFFEPQPPLGWFLISTVVHMTPQEIADTAWTFSIGNSFGEYPFVAARLFVAMFGLSIPLLAYWLARLLKLSPLEALLPAVFVAFDGGFILQSRLIMIESLWIACGLAGLCLVIFTVKHISRKQSYAIFIVLASLLLGFSLSIKWLGLGFTGLTFFYLFTQKKYRLIFAVGALVVFCYVFALLMYFNTFKPGPVTTGYYVSGPTRNIVFPGEGNWLENLKFVFTYSKLTFQMRANSTEISHIQRQSHPWDWPLMRTAKEYPYWWVAPENTNKKSKQFSPQIDIESNKVSWGAGLVSIAILLSIVLFSIARQKKWYTDEEALLIVAYSINFVPYLFIDYFSASPGWFYHYLTALCFSFLMVPFVIRRFGKHKEMVYVLLMFGVFLVFFYKATTIYGW